VRRLLPEITNAVYVDPGWLVHRRGDALYANAFDARTRVLGDETVRLAKDVRVSDWPVHALFGASRPTVSSSCSSAIRRPTRAP